MTTITTRAVNVSNVPVAALEHARGRAQRAGYGDSDAAAVRWALMFAEAHADTVLLQKRRPARRAKAVAR